MNTERKRQMFQQFKYKLQNWMQGRYGVDELSRMLSLLSLVILLVSLIGPLRFLSFVALFLIGYNLFRMFSRNITARLKERQAYLRLAGRVRPFFTVIRLNIKDRKTHRYFLCRNCRKVLRVPKGRGRIEIRCPGCGRTIIRNT